jgi:alpha-L-fucosidase
MKKTILSALVVLFALNFTPAEAQEIPGADTRWFEEARLGMFVHFGPYAVLGSGEWVMNTRPISRAQYMNLQNFFDPQAFDAAEWVSLAKRAGAKYLIITSRHHDGFSNWDTAQSEWNIMNTPYGKDLLAQLARECRAQGLKLGFYYSLVDWTRDDYEWRTGSSGQTAGRTAPSDWNSYIAFMKAQITELLTDYGDVAVMWFDGHWDQSTFDWHYPEIYSLIRRLQPNCLIANNHHLSSTFAGEDYQVFERDVPGENRSGYSNGQQVARMPLETCQTINGSWGYNITDTWYKSSAELIRLLVRTSGKGANLLLNVGPMPDGRIDPVSTRRLEEIGQWLGKWGETIYGTEAGFMTPSDRVSTTRKGDKYYIHIFPGAEEAVALKIPRFASARWLNVEGDLRYSFDRRTGYTTLILADTPLDPIDSIIEVTVK